MGSGPKSTLRGNSLRTYLYLLRHESAGAREVQRALRLSSPSLAQYHLEKLVEMGLAKIEDSGYKLLKEVKVDTLRDFFRIGSHLLPRFLVYAVMFTTMLVYFLLEEPVFVFEGIWALLSLGLAAAVFWFETWSAWRNLPD